MNASQQKDLALTLQVSEARRCLANLRKRGLTVKLKDGDLFIGPQPKLTALDRARIPDLKPALIWCVTLETQAAEQWPEIVKSAFESVPELAAMDAGGLLDSLDRWEARIYREFAHGRLQSEQAQECMTACFEAFCYWRKMQAAVEPEKAALECLARTYFDVATDILVSRAV